MRLANIFFIALILGSFALQSQTEEEALDKVFIPKKNSILSKESDNDFSGADSKNFVKVPLFMLIRNRFVLQYERKLTNYFAVNSGLGINYAPDFIFSTGSAGDFSFLDDNEGISLYDILSKNDFQQRGNIFANIGVRAYYDSFYFSEAMGYVEFGFRFNHLAYDYALEEGVTSTKEVSVNSRSYNFLIGSSFESSGGIHLKHDLYYGAGILRTSYTQLVSEQNNGFYNLTSTGEVNKNYTYTFILGYTLGFGF